MTQEDDVKALRDHMTRVAVYGEIFNRHHVQGQSPSRFEIEIRDRIANEVMAAYGIATNNPEAVRVVTGDSSSVKDGTKLLDSIALAAQHEMYKGFSDHIEADARELAKYSGQASIADTLEIAHEFAIKAGGFAKSAKGQRTDDPGIFNSYKEDARDAFEYAQEAAFAYNAVSKEARVSNDPNIIKLRNNPVLTEARSYAETYKAGESKETLDQWSKDGRNNEALKITEGKLVDAYNAETLLSTVSQDRNLRDLWQMQQPASPVDHHAVLAQYQQNAAHIGNDELAGRQAAVMAKAAKTGQVQDL